jgi:hypothetical protein
MPKWSAEKKKNVLTHHYRNEKENYIRKIVKKSFEKASAEITGKDI